jgi:hypothetical protein
MQIHTNELPTLILFAHKGPPSPCRREQPENRSGVHEERGPAPIITQGWFLGLLACPRRGRVAPFSPRSRRGQVPNLTHQSLPPAVFEHVVMTGPARQPGSPQHC